MRMQWVQNRRYTYGINGLTYVHALHTFLQWAGIAAARTARATSAAEAAGSRSSLRSNWCPVNTTSTADAAFKARDCRIITLKCGWRLQRPRDAFGFSEVQSVLCLVQAAVAAAADCPFKPTKCAPNTTLLADAEDEARSCRMIASKGDLRLQWPRNAFGFLEVQSVLCLVQAAAGAGSRPSVQADAVSTEQRDNIGRHIQSAQSQNNCVKVRFATTAAARRVPIVGGAECALFCSSSSSSRQQIIPLSRHGVH